MKKVFIVVIVLVVLAGAAFFYFTAKKQQPAGKKGTTSQESSSETTSGTTAKESPKQGNATVEGKMVGLNEKQMAVAKPEGGVETLNISGATPVFETDGTTKTGMGAVQLNKTIKVSYDEATKDVASIVLMEK